MKVPPRLRPLLEDGLIDDVLAQVKSGKEADVFVVRCGDERRCAKVFKEANQRSFRQAAIYQEGRRERSSRRSRAMSGRTRYGRQEQEKSWINAEVQALQVLADAGVRVPQPMAFVDGVLLMELITDSEGRVAPRLGEVTLDATTARQFHEQLIREVVRMLAAGLIHGDLSEFNILIDSRGPVIIDLPQAINAAANQSAAMLLVRDVDRLRRFFGRFDPQLLDTDYGKELWALYAGGRLHPDAVLSGRYEPDQADVNLDELMGIIDAARAEEMERRERLRTEFEDES
ncbi:MAG: phosphotransferase [Wenzhouxiangella sp.]|nr:phosphotransferase [Wenzhouxiangella sp.]TVR99312.1 MAG: serine protein kinase RIO [Wenzhouxiangellaceae bacterium]